MTSSIAMSIGLLCVAVAVITGAAGAEVPTCGGKDLLPQLEAADPAAYQAYLAAMAKVPNAEGLLWRLEKDQATPSWLFGTIHLSDDRVVRLPPAVEQVFAAAKMLLVETTATGSPDLARAMAADPARFLFTDGRSIQDVLPPDDLAALKSALARTGGAIERVQRLRPWLIAMSLAVPSCEAGRRSAGRDSLDVALIKRAKARGIAVRGLETDAEQFRAMAELPMDVQVSMLRDGARLHAQLDDFVETMVRLYLAHKPAALFWLSRVYSTEKGAELERLFAAIDEGVLHRRNLNMRDRALPAFQQGGAFMAVGAAHLPGENGLIELFRKAGYMLTRVD